MKDFDGRIFPWLWGFSCNPNIDKNVVKALGEHEVVDFKEFSREVIWPNRFLV